MEGIEQQFDTNVEAEKAPSNREEMMELAERRAEERFVEFMEKRGKMANIFEHGVETERNF